MIRVEHGDCLAVLPTLGNVDAIVTDPPYGLEFMGQEWDKLDGGLPQENVWKGRRGKGGSSVGDDDRTPGSRRSIAYGVKRQGFKRCNICGKRAFSGSPCQCLAPVWTIEYPDGPPSSAIRMQRWHEAWAREAYRVLKPGGYILAFGGTRTWHRLACAIEDAGFVIQDTIAWIYGTGFPKNKALLKPAFEPVIMAYKPGGKRALQINECRVGFANAADEAEAKNQNRHGDFGSGPIIRSVLHNQTRPVSENGNYNPPGRWPANLCLEECDEVLALFPQSKSTGGQASLGAFRNGKIYGKGRDEVEKRDPGFGDSGSAARFFYCAKADTDDRWGSRHPTVKPVDLMRWLVRLVTPPGGTVLDPFAGIGSTGVAALAEGRDAILIEREGAYIADIRERLAYYEGTGRHSLASKARSRAPRGSMPLFADRLSAAELEEDALGSHDEAMRAIGEQVRAGSELPPLHAHLFHPRRRGGSA